MAKLSDWIKTAVVKLMDPDKEERIQQVVARLHQGIVKQRDAFVLTAAIQGLEASTADLEQAKDRVFRHFLARGWADGRLTGDEQHTARWIAGKLELAETKAREINLEFARGHFAAALAKAMEDGVLDEREERQLQEIAASTGMPLPEFAREYFRGQGEAFLRGIFLACIADGTISQSEWRHLLATTEKLGLRRDELLAAVEPQARRFVEHVLADAKADGRLSARENESLHWLLNNLGLPSAYRGYVQREIDILQTLTAIEDGRLPSIPSPPGIELRAGEIVHYHATATWRNMRYLKSGLRADDHVGSLSLTDDRIVFSSATKAQSIAYRRIVSHSGGTNWIEVQVEGKAASVFFLHDASPVPYALFGAAVAMANQTKTAVVSGAPSRHIARDVRQRVWQQYGGQCAECGANDYLEFDHIIPVAKGGSNAETNIQLLCRRCNLKKSDRI